MVGNDHQKWSEMPVCPRHLTLSNCILRCNDHLSWSADPTTLFISGNEELLAVAGSGADAVAQLFHFQR